MSDDWPTLGDVPAGPSTGDGSTVRNAREPGPFTLPSTPGAAATPPPSEGERDADVPAGARCGVHTDVDARFLCVVCGTYGCAACAFARTERGTTCRACASRGLAETVPWERRNELGWVRAYWQTTRLVCMDPKRFFATPAGESGMMGPALFAVASYTLGGALLVLSFGLLMLLGAGVAVLADQSTLGAIFGIYGGCFTLGFIPFALLAYPLQGLVQVLIAAACSHGSLSLLKAQRATFEQSLRAVCYANAPYLWMFVPCIGWYGTMFWVWYCEAIALREAHRTTTDRAAIAVLGYRMIFFVGVVTMYALVIGAFFMLEATQRRGSPFG